jgi:phosphatidylglycerol:prolipoprotein diacylglycerol transferase
MNIIEFPRLWNIKFTVSPVAFTVFGYPIYWYGIIIAMAIFISLAAAMRHSKEYGIEPDTVIDLVLFAVPISIVASRLYYVIFSWDNFKDNLLEIFNTRHGGLAIYGAIIGAVIVAYIFAKRRKIGVLKLFDFLVPYLPLSQAIGRWGNFINQEAFGVNTRLPWGMTGDIIRQELIDMRLAGMEIDPSLPVHPTFLYESLWNIGVFFLLLRHRKRNKLEGEVFFLYMILYGVGRFWIEGLRTDSLMIGNLRISQVLAAVFAVSFGIVTWFRRKKAREVAIENIEIGESSYGKVLEKIREEELSGDQNRSLEEPTEDLDINP